MSELQEQTFGQESVERSLGYVPADVPMPEPPESQGDISIQETELRDAASELAKNRNARQREIESKPFDAEVRVQDQRGRHLPDNQTLSVEEASHLVTNARVKNEAVEDLNERDELAREIDALRNGTTFEQLQTESEALHPNEVTQQPVEQPQPSDHERAVEALKNNPTILAGLQAEIEAANQRANQAVYQAQQAAIQNGHAAAAALVSYFPELSGNQAHELQAGIKVIQQKDPQRAQQIVNFIDNITPIVRQAAELQQHRQQQFDNAFQQWQANQQTQWHRAAAACDQQYDQWSRNQGVSSDEQEAIRQEVFAEFARQGVSKEQVAQLYNSNPAIRSFAGQVQLHQAAAYRLQQQKMANIRRNNRDRTAPVVQHPGSPLARAPDTFSYEREQFGKIDNAASTRDALKAAASLIVSRRNARR